MRRWHQENAGTTREHKDYNKRVSTMIIAIAGKRQVATTLKQIARSNARQGIGRREPVCL